MNKINMMTAIRRELSVTNEDITIDHSSPDDKPIKPELRRESVERFVEFVELVKRIGELARRR